LPGRNAGGEVLVLKPGDKAPNFRLKTDQGATLSLADFRGRRVVLFFFPKANTPG
jgi:peroxiredoxin Q/BCP